MARNAEAAATYLKTLAHEGRLMILCHLGSGEKSVGELESLLDIRQAAVSQMLARLASVHPRVCGEQLKTCQSANPRDGSSPRVRGTVRDQTAHLTIARFIPACAGNSLNNAF